MQAGISQQCCLSVLGTCTPPLTPGDLHRWVTLPLPFPLTLTPFCLQLLDTKSTDRKQTLLHYISNVVKEKYQQVSLFYNELHYVEKAAAGTGREP